MEHAEHVDVEQALEGFGVDLQHRAVGGDAGVGHHDVDAAEALDGSIGRGLHRRQVTDVGDHRQDIVTERGGSGVQRRRVDVGQNQLGAFAVQPAGHLCPDPRSTTGDEDDFPVHRTHAAKRTPTVK